MKFTYTLRFAPMAWYKRIGVALRLMLGLDVRLEGSFGDGSPQAARETIEWYQMKFVEQMQEMRKEK